MSDAEEARLAVRVAALERAIPIYQDAIARLVTQVEDLNARLKAVERATPLTPKKGKSPRQRPMFESEIPDPEDHRWRL